jgi:hypothetical protein
VGGTADRLAPGDEDQANGQPFGYVVHRDSRGDENAERFAAAEGYADADALRERVQRHHPDDHQSLAGVCAAQSSQLQLAMTLQPSRAESDERNAEERSGNDAQKSRLQAFVDQTEAGGDHQSGGDGIRHRQPGTRHPPVEQKRERTQASGERCKKREDEDGERCDRKA